MADKPPQKDLGQRQKTGDTKTDAPASERIEVVAARIASVQRLLARPGADAEGKLFARFMSEIHPKISLPKTSQFVLDAFSSRDVTAEKVSLALKGNPYLQQAFYQVIESVGKRTEIPSLEAAVVLLGMQNSRNLILALQFQRTINRAQPEWTKEGKLKTPAADYLKYALKTEELLAANPAAAKEEYADLGFSAGALFDVFALLANQVEHKKKVLTLIETVHAQSFKTGMIAAEVARTMPELTYRRLFFAACLLHDIGKIAMAILDPSYIDFLDACTKKDLPRAVRRYAEAKRFGVNHSVLGAVICYGHTLFSPFSRAILYQHEPFLLSTRKKNLYQLTALISLSTNMASNFKKADKEDDPILALWKGPELKDLKVTPRALVQAVARVKV
jgi:HD-like signal output (HDOD) protein